MKVEPRDADKLIAAPPPARLFLFFGPDSAQAADLADRLAARLGGERIDFDARTLKQDPARLAAEAAAVSMFGDKHVLRVAADESVAEAAQLLLEAPAAGHPVILVAGDLKGTSPLRKIAEKHSSARSLACYLPDAQTFARLAREAARARGLDPDPAALTLLTAATAPERGVLAQEVDKLATYLEATPDTPKRLDPDHVRALVAGEAAADIDPLIDALSVRDMKAAAHHLTRLEAERTSGVTLIRAAARRLAQLSDARAAIDAGSTPEAAVDAMRPPIFWKAKPAFLAALKRWRGEELAAAQTRLLAAERGVKSAASVGETLAFRALLEIAVC